MLYHILRRPKIKHGHSWRGALVFRRMNGRPVYRQWALLLGAIVIALFALWWPGDPKAPAGPAIVEGTAVSVRVRALTPTDTIFTRQVEVPAGATARSALEAAALVAGVQVGVQEYEFGVLIVRIGSVAAGSNGHWTYLVNDTMPSLGADACPVYAGDRIDFHFGERASDSI
jgi:hypothetical protein